MTHRSETFNVTASKISGLAALKSKIDDFLSRGYKAVTISIVHQPVSDALTSYQALLIYEDGK